MVSSWRLKAFVTQIKGPSPKSPAGSATAPPNHAPAIQPRGCRKEAIQDAGCTPGQPGRMVERTTRKLRLGQVPFRETDYGAFLDRKRLVARTGLNGCGSGSVMVVSNPLL